MTSEMLDVEHESIPGYIVQRTVMPRIPHETLKCVLYLYQSVDDAQKGTIEIGAGGTGFLISVPSVASKAWRYAYGITNKHVVRQFNSPVIRLNNARGGFEVIPLKGKDWIDHPDGDDLAICEIPIKSELYDYLPVHREIFLTEEILESWSIGLGDDVFQVGRFVNHEGRERNTPTARFGNIAMMPTEPVKLPYDGHLQEAFLVESHTKGGYSGSPVFFQPYEYREPWISKSKAEPDQWWPIVMIGVAQGFVNDMETAKKNNDEEWQPDPQTRVYFRFNTGMEVVIPAWRLSGLIDHPQLVKNRAKADKHNSRLSRAAPPTPC